MRYEFICDNYDIIAYLDDMRYLLHIIDYTDVTDIYS